MVPPSSSSNSLFVATGGVFDWRKPTLASLSASLDDHAVSKLLHRLVVTEAVLRVLGKGDAGRPVLASIASCLARDLPEQIAVMKGPVLKQTAAELKVLGEALEAMLGVTSGADDIVEQAKALFPIMRKFVSQSTYWREEDRKLTVAKAALSTFAPEVAAMTKQIQELSVDGWPKTQTLVGRVRVWEEGNKWVQKCSHRCSV